MKDPAYVAGADSLARYLVQTLAPPIVDAVANAIRAWRQVELGPAPVDLAPVFAEQNAEVERKLRERFDVLDEPGAGLGKGNVGSGE